MDDPKYHKKVQIRATCDDVAMRVYLDPYEGISTKGRRNSFQLDSRGCVVHAPFSTVSSISYICGATANRIETKPHGRNAISTIQNNVYEAAHNTSLISYPRSSSSVPDEDELTNLSALETGLGSVSIPKTTVLFSLPFGFYAPRTSLTYTVADTSDTSATATVVFSVSRPPVPSVLVKTLLAAFNPYGTTALAASGVFSRFAFAYPSATRNGLHLRFKPRVFQKQRRCRQHEFYLSCVRSRRNQVADSRQSNGFALDPAPSMNLSGEPGVLLSLVAQGFNANATPQFVAPTGTIATGSVREATTSPADIGATVDPGSWAIGQMVGLIVNENIYGRGGGSGRSSSTACEMRDVPLH